MQAVTALGPEWGALLEPFHMRVAASLIWFMVTLIEKLRLGMNLLKHWYWQIKVISESGYGRHGEFSAAVFSFLFGCWLLAPGSTLETTRALEEVANRFGYLEELWGLIFCLLGASGVFALIERNLRWRVALALLQSASWGYWLALYLFSPAWPSASVPFLMAMVVLSCWAAYRIPHHQNR